MRRFTLGLALAAIVLAPGSALAQSRAGMVTLTTGEGVTSLPAGGRAQPPAKQAWPMEPAAAPRPTTAFAALAPVAASASVGTGAENGPLIAYVSHPGPPSLADLTPASAMLPGLFGMAGGVGMAVENAHAGRSIARENGLEDPSGRMAHALAVAYAATVGGRVAPTAVIGDASWLHLKPGEMAQRTGGARYLIAVSRPGMTLMYHSFDWEHRDLLLTANAFVVDTANGGAVAKARCFVRTDHANDLTHDDLLYDHAAALKRLIIRKSDACVAQLEAGFHLPLLAEPYPAADGQPGDDGAPQAQAVYRF